MASQDEAKVVRIHLDFPKEIISLSHDVTPVLATLI